MSTYAAEGVKFVCAITFGIISARALGPEGRGLVAAAWTSVTIAVMLVSFGISKSLISRLNDPYQPFEIADYYGALIVLWLITSLIGLTCLAVLVPELDATERWLAYSVLAFSIPVQLATSVAQGILRARRRILLLNGIGVAASVARLALLGLFWSLGQVTVLAVLAIEATYWLLLGLASAATMWGSLFRRPRFVKTAAVARSLLSYGLMFQIYSILFGLQLKIIIPILNTIAGAEATGFFSVGSRLAEYLSTFSSQILFVFVPYLAQMSSTKAVWQNSFLLCRLGIVFLLPAALLLALSATHLIVFLYGNEFAQSSHTLRILLPGVVSGVLFQFLAVGAVAKGQIVPVAIAAGLGLLANAMATYLLVPVSGASGAAIAVTTGYGLSLALYALYVSSKESVAVTDLFIPKLSDVRRVFKSVA